MELHIGAPMVSVSGQTLGKLTHVIIDPDTKEVERLVLAEHGITGRSLVVPIGAVNTAEPGEITLQLDPGQMDQLEEFASTLYVAPPADSIRGLTWAESALLVPQLAPSAGLGSAPLMVPTPPAPDMEQPSDAGHSVDVETTTEVWATDGHVGSVHELTMDEQTRRVTRLVVRKGILFTRDTEVPVGLIDHVSNSRVTLKVAKSELPASQ
jgi:uncharacterized protein YrrD